jgi:hypothetical protein
VSLALLAGLLYVVAHQFLGLVEDLPLYRNNLRAKIGMLSGPASSGLEQSAATLKELGEELQKATPGKVDTPRVAMVQIVEPPPNAMQVMRGVFGPLIAPAGTAAIVVVFVIFMLLQREDLRDRLVRLLGAREMHTTVLALDDAAQRVSRYLLWQTLINSIQGALVTVGLYFIGVPDPALWGALTVVLRFIPYLGPLLAAIRPDCAIDRVLRQLERSADDGRVDRDAGACQQQPARAVVVRLECRRVLVRADRRNGVLSLAVGNSGRIPCDTAHCLPGGDGQVHPAIRVHEGDADRSTGAHAAGTLLPAALGR